jgi:hypothetical protein
MSTWEVMAKQDFDEERLAVFYERAGKYRYDAGMPQEEADKRSFLEVVRINPRFNGLKGTAK